MFYSSRHVVEKPLPNAPLEEKNSLVESIATLQKYYKHEDYDTKRISIRMDDIVQPEEKEYISLKQHSQTEMNAISIMLDRDIKKALWVDDPLRLNLNNNNRQNSVEQEKQEAESSLFPFANETELPFQFKLKSSKVETNLMFSLYIVIDQQKAAVAATSKSTFKNNNEYLSLVFELPYATAAFIAPTPPPKEISSTPAFPPPAILPVDLYEIHNSINDSEPTTWNYENLAPSWIYSRDEDQSTLMTNSPHMSTAAASILYFQREEDINKDFTDETWEAIFHPLSTFKHNQGELEYYAWNPSNLPVAAARVAQRVMNARAFGPDDDTLLPLSSSSEDTVEATIPRLMPTPPLKPSPVLTILSEKTVNELEKDDSQLTLVESVVGKQEEGYYFDMLQKIRGGESYSNTCSLDSRLTSGDEEEEAKQQVDQVPSIKNKNVARIAKGYLLSAILTKKQPTAAEKHTVYNMEDDVSTSVRTMDPEILMEEKPCYWTEKRLFWTGFVCPLFWFYGSFNIRSANHDPNSLRWQKRCRMASLYFSIVLSIVVLVASVKAAGSAGVRQAQSDTIRAVIAN